jgi:hypothetical protein
VLTACGLPSRTITSEEAGAPADGIAQQLSAGVPFSHVEPRETPCSRSMTKKRTGQSRKGLIEQAFAVLPLFGSFLGWPTPSGSRPC